MRTLTLPAVALGLLLAPALVRAGTGVWTPTGPSGGFVNAVVLAPNGAAYAATSVGVYMSSTLGHEGTPWALRVRLDGGVSALALHPTQSSTLYAGAGDSIYRSGDSAATWSVVKRGLQADVTAIAIDPQQPQNILVGTWGECVWSTSNGGTAWTQHCSGLPGRVHALALDPVTPTTAYAVADGGVFRSTDRGLTWTAVVSGLDGVGVSGALAVDPQNPAIVYASYSGQFGGQHLYKSTDGGTSWTTLADEGIACFALAVDPSDSSIVYQGTLGALNKSTDGGATWTVSLPGNQVNGIAINPSNPAVLYAARADGVLRTSDRGATWIENNDGYNITGIAAIAVNGAKNTLLTSVYCSTVFYSTDDGVLWNPTDVCYAWGLAVDTQDPMKVYAADSCGISKSVDGGINWTWLGFIPSGDPYSIVQSMKTVEIDPSTTPSTVYAGAPYHGLYRSIDEGASWQRIGFKDKTVTDIAIDPQTPTTLWVTTGDPETVWDGHINKSTDGGVTWTSWNPIVPPSGDHVRLFYSVAIDPQTPSTVYVGAEQGLFRTVDGGATWEVVKRGLHYKSVLVDPVVPAIVYVGADGPCGDGMSRSEDGGTNWMRVEAGLDDHNITSMAIDPRNHQRVFVGTHHSGMYERIFDRAGGDPEPAFPMGKLVLTIGRLGSSKGESIVAHGTILFPGNYLPTGPLGVDERGMRVRVEDVGAGDAVVLDITMPAGPVGSPEHCGPLDGWKRVHSGTTQTYTNKSGEMLPPKCTTDSSRGIVQAKAKDNTARGQGAEFVLKGRGGRYGPVTGPLRLTVTLGGASEAAAGQVGQHQFQVSECARTGTKMRCRMAF